MDNLVSSLLAICSGSLSFFSTIFLVLVRRLDIFPEEERLVDLAGVDLADFESNAVVSVGPPKNGSEYEKSSQF